jgi:hypothetical protein
MTSAPASASKRGWWVPFSLGLTAIVLALASLIPALRVLHWWATPLQLLGASTTFVGFWSAYVRAAHGRNLGAQFRVWAKRFGVRLRLMWYRLRKKPINAEVHVVAPFGATGGMGSPTVTASSTFRPNPALSPEEQFAELVAFVNNVAGRLPEVEKEIGRLDGRIDGVIADTAKGVADALAHAESVNEQLQARLDLKQVLDLRWAITGLAITVAGILLSYF